MTPIFGALIIGGGIAGLRAAVEIAPGGGRVGLLMKDGPTDSSTDKAQGGLAAVLSDDDEVALHYEDTLRAGDGLCSEGAVRILVEEGPARALELIKWGARFDREGARLALAREAAHSKRRILRAQGDSTGREIVRALVQKTASTPGVEFLPRLFSIDLVMQGGCCVGLAALEEQSGSTHLMLARAVVLATGGAGQVYRETTNPPQATGDGLTMAYRAGAEMMDLEFVQFHPTALSLPGVPRFLLSEAMRGEGGRLLNVRGEPFMEKVDPRGDLAPRDVVARGITEEIRRSGHACVFLDMTACAPDFVRRRFPTIAATCAQYGLDVARDRLPVTPCAHYMMGGVRTDAWGRTSIPGLYAAGEVACNGVHGANRLASNSLLEGLVFGARAGQAVLADRPAGPDLFAMGGLDASHEASGAHPSRVLTIPEVAAPATVAALREVMWKEAGIVRDGEGLRRALALVLGLEKALTAASPSRAGLEARNMLFAGRLISECALRREESRGSHFRTDFPRAEPGRGRHSIVAPGAPAADLTRLPRRGE